MRQQKTVIVNVISIINSIQDESLFEDDEGDEDENEDNCDELPPPRGVPVEALATAAAALRAQSQFHNFRYT